MSRVRTVYYTRRLMAPLVVKPILLLGLLTAIWFKVSVADVVHNAVALGRPGLLYHFTAAAFAQTELAVKILSVGLLSVMIGLGVDLARNLSLVVLAERWPVLRFHRLLRR